ncbi:MAG: phage Gp37/Gp68 family protein [Lachnospiraceae bacterium]|nr:phage Gp37/Gp68 family protein [Lachnospiraceae bacterium]
MGNKTKIDWCDSTWNPVTGCRHGCEYCYARGIANRFRDRKRHEINEDNVIFIHHFDGTPTNYELNKQCYYDKIDDLDRIPTSIKAPYPYGFAPTFHRYRLNDYIEKKGRNIFVCSMADLFGAWVPLEWQREVFAACRKAPQHNYIFLTKNPGMYAVLDKQGELPTDSNMWFGTSVTTPDDPFPYNGKAKHNLFLSMEPLLADFGVGQGEALKGIGWVIIGAETGRRKGKIVPEKSWVDNIVEQCKALNIPVFMKESLRALYGDNLLREFPQGLIRG